MVDSGERTFTDAQEDRLCLIAQRLGMTRIQVLRMLLDTYKTPEMRYCEECQTAFLIHDRRQRYCSSRCASRVRMRRYYAKKRACTHEVGRVESLGT